MFQELYKKEKELIENIINGNLTDFTTLIEPYYEKLYLKVRSIIKDPDESYDVLQEALISAYNSLNKFKGNSSIYTWLYKIVVNKSIDYLKRKKKKDKIQYSFKKSYDDREEEGYNSYKNYYELQENYEQNELFEYLIDLIENMDKKYKEILIMKYFDELSYEEIADIKQIKLGTVKSRLNKAKEILKKKLIKENKFVDEKLIVIIFLNIIMNFFIVF